MIRGYLSILLLCQLILLGRADHYVCTYGGQQGYGCYWQPTGAHLNQDPAVLTFFLGPQESNFSTISYALESNNHKLGSIQSYLCGVKQMLSDQMRDIFENCDAHSFILDLPATPTISVNLTAMPHRSSLYINMNLGNQSELVNCLLANPNRTLCLPEADQAMIACLEAEMDVKLAHQQCFLAWQIGLISLAGIVALLLLMGIIAVIGIALHDYF